MQKPEVQECANAQMRKLTETRNGTGSGKPGVVARRVAGGILAILRH
jgi:hypothetical protein